MNLSGLLPLLNQLPHFDTLPAQMTNGALDVLHLPSSARAPILAQLYQQLGRPILLLAANAEAVTRWRAALEAWLPPGTSLLRFPEPTPLPYERAPWSADALLGRMTVLTRLMAGQHPLLPARETSPFVLASPRALLQKTLPKRKLLMTLKVVKVNQIIDLEKTMAIWESVGYERVTVVEGPCQFSQRGGILDIYPSSSPYPVRMELFGDEVDTLRYFDPTTQRSIAGDVTRIVVPPAREALPSMAAKVGEMLALEAPPKEDDLPAWQDDIETLAQGKPFQYLEYYLQMMYTRPDSLLDYLPNDTLIVVDDWAALQAGVRKLQGRALAIAGQQATLPAYFPSPLFNWDDIAADLTQRGMTILGEMVEEPEPPQQDEPLISADYIQPGLRHGGQERPFLTQLQRAADLEERVVIVSRQSQRLMDMWRDFKGVTRLSSIEFLNNRVRPNESLLETPVAGSLTFINGTLAEGFTLENEAGRPFIHLLTDAEIFGWNRPAPRRRKFERAVAPETYFSDIKPGDHIVHLEYGIGRYLGLVTRKIGGTEREYLQIDYANNDTLYIPVHHADRLSKWIGDENSSPQLHRVGEKRWRQAKERAQKAVNELAEELLELYAAREEIPGHAFSADSEWQAELEASFPYTETADQLEAILAVKADMEKSTPMDRLICGDVGFGKTEVALRAAFKAVMDGKQVAMLVPTTVLAQQHFNTFSQRLRPFPVIVKLLSRFQTDKEAQQILTDLRDGKIDIVVGTHRLLSNDIGFKDLGLLIIDEEQRFGVTHKEKLKQLRAEVDVLTMTATPIPRTLYMGLSGIRDISIITTPPQDRLPVQTYVGQSDDELIRRAIVRELERNGQVFFVHNHVQTINNAYRYVESLIPDARIAIGHGQLPEGMLADVMRQFEAHEIDILVCTTIIESGIDIPNANTLIVDRAENFGLAQLYQLRGRVGRSTQRAYAYFFHRKWRSLTPEARARLETLDEHQELGAGYSIAMRDLEIRGSGELLGGGQSGHIAGVGFDLYTRMLARAVKARRMGKEGVRFSAEIPDAVTIDLPIPAYIPTDFIPDANLRLRLYRRMAGLETLDEIGEMASELTDRFGSLPAPVDNLLYSLRVKVLATRAGAPTIFSYEGQVRIKMNLEYMDRVSMQRFIDNDVRVGKTAIWLTPNLPTKELKLQLVKTLERLGDYFEQLSSQLPLL